MEKVKVSVKGAGSLEVESHQPPKVLMVLIETWLLNSFIKFHKVKRGPKKKVRTLDEGSDGNNHD